MPRRKTRGGRRPGAGRPTNAPKRHTIAVRIDDDEAATLAKIDPRPSTAIHALIAERAALAAGEGTKT